MSSKQPTPLEERLGKIAVPYRLDLTGRVDRENRVEEVTVSVPLGLMRHIYFVLCAANQKDPDNAQLNYIFTHAAVFQNKNDFPPNGKSNWIAGEDAYVQHTKEPEYPRDANILKEVDPKPKMMTKPINKMPPRVY